MPRPSLTAALARLADLRGLRDTLAKERGSIVVRDEPDCFRRLGALDADRLTVDRAIRDARGLMARLLAEQVRKHGLRPAG